MSPANAALKSESKTESETTIQRSPGAALPGQIPLRLANASSDAVNVRLPLRPVSAQSSAPGQNGFQFQARMPVIIGEATYRGVMPVVGVISGQLNPSGGALAVRQRQRSVSQSSGPELDGELGFKDVLRVNGHIAGKVFSEKGKLMIDAAARVDGDIEVGVAVIGGIVNGDVVGRERVELGPGAVINGNISTRSLGIKPGAVFTGDCRMLKDEDGAI